MRAYVDWRVKLLVEEAGDQAPELDKRDVRAELLSLFTETILVDGRRTPLLLALHASATSLCRVLTTDDRTLALPKGLPLSADLLDFEGS